MRPNEKWVVNELVSHPSIIRAFDLQNLSGETLPEKLKTMVAMVIIKSLAVTFNLFIGLIGSMDGIKEQLMVRGILMIRTFQCCGMDGK